MTLEQFFKENSSVALGFSGGMDSSYLLYAGFQYGANVKPYFVKTVFQPEFELTDAKHLAVQLGAELTVLELDILCNAEVLSNPADRCYHCKRTIFGNILRQAQTDGFTTLIDGSNASDDAGDRPGMKVLDEFCVRSPLRECGITKDKLRRLSKEAGLFTWDKPAYACLATRIPTGRPYTKELLRRVECAENMLFRLGFADFRVRVYDEAARLQFPLEQLNEAVIRRNDIIRGIKPYFSAVLLDLEGR